MANNDTIQFTDGDKTLALIQQQAARIASLEAALAQYADRQNWGYYDDSGCFKGAGEYTDACQIGPEVAEAALRKESK